jgi:hypothetical protein
MQSKAITDKRQPMTYAFKLYLYLFVTCDAEHRTARRVRPGRPPAAQQSPLQKRALLLETPAVLV